MVETGHLQKTQRQLYPLIQQEPFRQRLAMESILRRQQVLQ